jgi:hypothetical protein
LRAFILGYGPDILVLGAIGAMWACNPVCKFRGTINQPENLTMRRSLLRKGMGDFCKQMTTRNAPLKLSPDSPVIGRFYPQQCSSRDDEQLYVQFAGIGYGWTNVTKKMSFTSNGAAMYRYDFQVREDGPCDVYAYFRPSRVDASDFHVQHIESGAAQMFNAFTAFGDNFGRQLVSSKLREGFTVISYDAREDSVDFGLGIVPLGQKPFHPYQTSGSDRATYESDRTEVHQNQRDFVGPILVEGDGKAIFVTAAIDGAPAIDVLVMRKYEGDAALRLYFDAPQAGPLAAPPMVADVIRQGTELKRAVPAAPGMYYVIFDNTPSAGQVSPPMNTLDDRAAVVNYLIQIGDAS